jgi:8-amino-7-oxononanoate synthase
VLLDASSPLAHRPLTRRMRPFESELASLREAGLLRELVSLRERRGATVRLGGADLISFSSNDYLGLAEDPQVRATLVRAVEEHGAGAGASRLISGNWAPHADLEETLAWFKGTEAALSFASGYATAVGTLSGLLTKGDVVIIDKRAHASLIDGARLSGAALRTFPHNDLARLEHRLEWAKATATKASRVLVVTEAIFSMDGDRAPLREIVEMKNRHGALLLVDEAHSVGLIGRGGRGLADELGVAGGVDFQFGTLSKAVGLAGGYVAGSKAAMHLLINRARSFIYSTAPPPALAATASFVLREMLPGRFGDEARARLWSNARQFCGGTGLGEPSSAIVPVIIGAESRALGMAAALRGRGFLLPAVRFPTVPRGQARLRVTLSASHAPEQIDGLIDALRAARSHEESDA